jgi:hypothetical protein
LVTEKENEISFSRKSASNALDEIQQWLAKEHSKYFGPEINRVQKICPGSE